MNERLQVGDKIDLTGWFDIPNSDRKWWQFWKPKTVKTYGAQQHVITAHLTGGDQ